MRLLNRWVIFAGLTVAGACSANVHQEPPPVGAPSAKAASSPSPAAPAGKVAAAPPGKLFDRLGGQPAVTAVIDAFLKRVAADKRINGRFINTDMPRLRSLLIEFVSSATGGKVEYTGREMYVAHAGLQLIDPEFDALVEDLVGALVELHVPEAEKGELLGALGPLKSKIVNPPPAAAGHHDPALAQRAQEIAAGMRGNGQGASADLLELAVQARVRGQRNYAEQLFSAVERQVGATPVAPVAQLFREGAPERITTPLVQMPSDTPPQPKLAVGGSEDDQSPPKEARASLTGKLAIEGGADLLGVVTLDRVGAKAATRTPKKRTMEQRDRQFAPRLLAVPVGSTVAFPNFDPIYHNVFSLSPARAFDLGIFKNGEAREVSFGKEGLIRLGCNLHSNMLAHVVVVASAHYVVTSPGGKFTFRSLPPGKYHLRAWGENSTEPVSRTVVIHAGANTVDMSVPSGTAGGMGTDKFGIPRGDDR